MKRSLINFVLSILLIGITLPSDAQNRSNSSIPADNSALWLMLIGEYKTKPDSKWAAYSEAHLRAASMGQEWQQWIIRPGIHFRPNSHLQLSVGYTWSRLFPYGEQPIAHATTEHNVWAQILVKHKILKIPMYQHLRLEERFIGIQQLDEENVWYRDHFKQVQRLRYRIGSTFPAKGKLSSYYLSLFHATFIDMQKSASGHHLNQSWMYAALGKKVGLHHKVQLGYHYQWLRKSDGIHRERNHSIMLIWKFLLGS